VIGARDDRLAGFKRLTQSIQHIRLELRYYGANSPIKVLYLTLNGYIDVG
jgi:hypothetical protein